MSTAGSLGGAAAPQPYFCHQCDRNVSVNSAPDGELFCTICNGSFVEEIDIPNPNPNFTTQFFSFPPPPPPSDPLPPTPSPFSFLFGGPAFSFDVRSPTDLAGLLGPDPPAHPTVPAPSGPEPFNPMAFMQNHLQSLLSGGATIQFVIEGGGGSGSGPGGSLGDYFFGPGLEQLIQQLAENDPNRYGTPPASKSAVDALPDITVSQDLLSSSETNCAVCIDALEVGTEAKQMPCKHIFHKDCIIPWLTLHNSCPVCRCELPTDDLDYEHRSRGAPAPTEHMAAGATGSGSTGGAVLAATGDAPGPRIRMVERRFRIALPLPLRSLGQNSEASDSGNGANSGRGGGTDANSGGR